MSETPGPPADPAGTPPEPEQGYWEQQAAQSPPGPEQQGIQLNPQSAYPAQGSTPGSPPPYAQPHPQQYPPQYPPPPYSAPYAGYGQPGYPAPSYPAPPTSGYGVPDSPRATLALILGLIGTVGAFTCLLPVLVAPFAWVIGAKARREIRESNGRLGGSASATWGMALGIVGTVLLALLILGIVLIVVLAVNFPGEINVDTGTAV